MLVDLRITNPPQTTQKHTVGLSDLSFFQKRGCHELDCLLVLVHVTSLLAKLNRAKESKRAKAVLHSSEYNLAFFTVVKLAVRQDAFGY
jgi:hypothetical protein